MAALARMQASLSQVVDGVRQDAEAVAAACSQIAQAVSTFQLRASERTRAVVA